MATETVNAASTKNEMSWEDPVVTDELFGRVVKGIFWGGFGILAAARVAIGITSLVIWSRLVPEMGRDSAGIVAAQSSQQMFLFVEGMGALIFSGGFLVAALVQSRMPTWARVTLLCVAGFFLIGSNVAATFSLSNLLMSNL